MTTIPQPADNGADIEVIELPDLSQDIEPALTYDEEGYSWKTYEPPYVSAPLHRMTDKETEVTVSTMTSGNGKRFASIKAWVAGRHSREEGDVLKIMRKIVLEGVNAAAKLERFVKQGHNSLADIAEVQLDIDNIPMATALKLFHMTQVHAGQEKSTRYQLGFRAKPMSPLEQLLKKDELGDGFDAIEVQYDQFANHAIELFERNNVRVASALRGFYKPQTEGEETSGDLRGLDCARFFFLMGQRTGMSLKLSARHWSQVIGELKGSDLEADRRLGVQIQRMLAPDEVAERELRYTAEAPTLVRHTKENKLFRENLDAIMAVLENETDLLSAVEIKRGMPARHDLNVRFIGPEFTEGQKMLCQYIMTKYPGMDDVELLKWIQDQDHELQRRISKMMFNGHSDYIDMPQQSVTTGMTLVMEGSTGTMRDWNRHRAMGRFIPLPYMYGDTMTYDQVRQVIGKGFVLPLHLTGIEEFADVTAQFEADMQEYYQQLVQFLDAVHDQYGEGIDYTFAMNLLPLGHRTPIYMHGDIKKHHYMTWTRHKTGGQVDYRWQAATGSRLIAESDPLLDGIELEAFPNLHDPVEFFGRK